MRDRVLIKNDGFFFKHYDVDLQKVTEKRIEEEEIFNYLRYECDIYPDVTLRDIMTSVAMMATLEEYIGDYSWCPVERFRQILGIRSHAHQHIEYLELNKTLIIGDYVDDQNISVENNFVGIGSFPDGIESDQNEEYTWYIEENFVSVLDFPVHINKYISVDYLKDVDLKDVELKDFDLDIDNDQDDIDVDSIKDEDFLNNSSEILSVFSSKEMEFSFLDVLDTIYFIVGFYGDPIEAKKFWDHVEQLRQENDDFIPFEDIKKEQNAYFNILKTISDIVLKDTAKSSWDDVWNNQILPELDFDLNEFSFNESLYQEKLKKFWLEEEFNKIHMNIMNEKMDENILYEIKKIIKNKE